MPRWLIAALLVSGSVAHADDVAAPGVASSATASASAPSDMGDQAISALLGVAGGGRTTPGGLLVAGHYYYQLNDQDWFDGAAQFIFGSGEPDCFRDRMNTLICDHGVADGYAGEVSVAARHFLPSLASGSFWPYFRAGLAGGLVRFSDDDITGLTLTGIGGVGMRASVAEAIAVTAGLDLRLGIGFMGDVGVEPQLGIAIAAGAEFKL